MFTNPIEYKAMRILTMEEVIITIVYFAALLKELEILIRSEFQYPTTFGISRYLLSNLILGSPISYSVTDSPANILQHFTIHLQFIVWTTVL